MQTFANYAYERPDLPKVKEDFYQKLEQFQNAASMEQAITAIDTINAIRNHLSTMYNLVFIRASIDTRDAFYHEERDFLMRIFRKFRNYLPHFIKNS